LPHCTGRDNLDPQPHTRDAGVDSGHRHPSMLMKGILVGM
jgi:hypothetical protein